MMYLMCDAMKMNAEYRPEGIVVYKNPGYI